MKKQKKMIKVQEKKDDLSTKSRICRIWKTLYHFTINLNKKPAIFGIFLHSEFFFILLLFKNIIFLYKFSENICCNTLFKKVFFLYI